MTSVVVEFVGGPLDGEWRQMPVPLAPVFLVPVCRMTCASWVDETQPVSALQRTLVYRLWRGVGPIRSRYVYGGEQ